MKVSVAIMAHPDRAAWVTDLQATLGPVPVAWAEPPYADEDDRSPVWRTCRAALLLHTDAPFHCVLQDDAVLGHDFTARLERLVEAGEFIYMLFFRQKRAYQEANALAIASLERGYFTMRGGPMLGVGLVFPTDRIADLVQFGDGADPVFADDERIKEWAKKRRLTTYVPMPSMVNHRGTESLVGHRIPNRVAWRFA